MELVNKPVKNKKEKKRSSMTSSIATRWRQLSGEGNWKGLLNPLDSDLRRYIIHYGERVGAVGDIFNDKTKEPNASKQNVFTEACIIKGNDFKYDVTHFLYAASDDVESAWFGYVAVTTDAGKAVVGRRDILVAWRGTRTDQEWINNANGVVLKSASELFGSNTKAMVHSGFLSLYTGTRPTSANNKTSARKQVLGAIRELVNKYQNEEISVTVTGHSLGAALATLTAMDIVANKYNKPTNNPSKPLMVTAFVYGGPRVGDTGLKEEFSTLGATGHLHLMRITNYSDVVPQVPAGPLYTHLGIELMVDTSKSDYLTSKDSTTAHVLDVYLHGVAGVQQSGFRLAAKHDTALINKYTDCLKVTDEKKKIPPCWWTGENRKRMVQMEDGHWEVVDGK